MKSALRSRLILCIALIGSLAIHQVSAQVITKKLGVKGKTQAGSKWCWAACAEMILVFLNADPEKVSQCVQVSDKLEMTCCGAAAPDACDQADGFPDFLRYGFTCETTDETALTFEQIRDQIDRKKPVGFSWHFEDGTGHMLVAAGYKISSGKKKVWVLDPARGPGGAWKLYDYYDQGGDGLWHWNDFYEITKE